MRANLKEEIRSRSNAFADACLKEIDKTRKLEEAKALSEGKPSPFKKNNAQSTNKGVNKLGNYCKTAGRACVVASVAIEGYNIASAPEGEKLKETTRATGRLGGGLLGGGAVGSALGTLGANPATIILGTLIGGIAGAIGGEEVVDSMWNYFN